MQCYFLKRITSSLDKMGVGTHPSLSDTPRSTGIALALPPHLKAGAIIFLSIADEMKETVAHCLDCGITANPVCG